MNYSLKNTQKTNTVIRFVCWDRWLVGPTSNAGTGCGRLLPAIPRSTAKSG